MMNSFTNKDMNSQGQLERKVETVDYQSSAGQGQEKRPVEIIHHHPLPTTHSNQKTSGAVLTNAAASVVSTLDSAKEAISNSKA
ncbi:unnamed protein product [Cuscuta epithymum]|uniref:Uncharacterized protein n=1 Tax=Cuscuta epithymum TaxID=186058 RepID=A0AAV0D300_9ASTE|nr:unnamed protein product [Cuscuta epithymum]CAH9124714.1 unnamed protein product [Cuscuta epithymum]